MNRPLPLNIDQKLYMIQTSRLLKLYSDLGQYENAFFILIKALKNLEQAEYEPIWQPYIDSSGNIIADDNEKN